MSASRFACACSRPGGVTIQMLQSQSPPPLLCSYHIFVHVGADLKKGIFALSTGSGVSRAVVAFPLAQCSHHGHLVGLEEQLARAAQGNHPAFDHEQAYAMREFR